VLFRSRELNVSGCSTIQQAWNAAALVSQYLSLSVIALPGSVANSSYAGRPITPSRMLHARDRSAASTSRPVMLRTSATVTKDGAVGVSPAPMFGEIRIEIAPLEGNVWLPVGHATVKAPSYIPGVSVSPSPQDRKSTRLNSS